MGMKSALKTILKLFATCVIAWTTSASAEDVQFKIEEFYDDSASLKIENVISEKFNLNTGKIRKPYQKGDLWLRVSIEAFQPNLFLLANFCRKFYMNDIHFLALILCKKLHTNSIKT